MPVRHEQERFYCAYVSNLRLRRKLLSKYESRHQLLAVLPESVMYKEISRLAANTREYVIPRRYHQDCTAEDRVVCDQPTVILMIGIEVCQYWR